jgi:hypothetical protein
MRINVHVVPRAVQVKPAYGFRLRGAALNFSANGGDIE